MNQIKCSLRVTQSKIRFNLFTTVTCFTERKKLRVRNTFRDNTQFLFRILNLNHDRKLLSSSLFCQSHFYLIFAHCLGRLRSSFEVSPVCLWGKIVLHNFEGKLPVPFAGFGRVWVFSNNNKGPPFYSLRPPVG